MKNSIYIFTIVVLLFIIGCNTDTTKNSSTPSTNVNEQNFQFLANDVSLQKYNFSSRRVYYNDTMFSEYGLICSSDTDVICSLKFSNRNNNWNVWDGKTWRKFINGNNEIDSINLIYANRTIKYLTKYFTTTDTLLCFKCRENNLDFSTDNNEFIFSKKMGIVTLKNEMTFYKRKDYENKDLVNQLSK